MAPPTRTGNGPKAFAFDPRPYPVSSVPPVPLDSTPENPYASRLTTVSLVLSVPVVGALEAALVLAGTVEYKKRIAKLRGVFLTKYRFSKLEHAIEVKFFCGTTTSGFAGFHGYHPLGGHELPIVDLLAPYSTIDIRQ